jgi:uncharacterized protein YjbI with pentapeptide repeats
MVSRRVNVSATEAAKLIKNGMSDTGLMERFGVTAKGLRSLFNKLVASGMLSRADLANRVSLTSETVAMEAPFEAERPAAPQRERKTRIDAHEAISAIRGGMDDADLMKRFGLSARGLHSLFSKLVKSGLISRYEIELRNSASGGTVVVDREELMGPPSDFETSEIQLAGVLRSVKLGLTRRTIMDKHNLSSSELQSIVSALVARGSMEEGALDLKSGIVDIRSYEIRQRVNNKLLFSESAPSITHVLEKAVSLNTDLAMADLGGVNLSKADLAGASMPGADLSRCNLSEADLSLVNLSGANLAFAEMFGATLYKTNLSNADLTSADLTMVYGVGCVMPGANLAGADLTNANLVGSDMKNTDFFQTILNGANLSGASLKGANLEPAQMENLNIEDPFCYTVDEEKLNTDPIAGPKRTKGFED